MIRFLKTLLSERELYSGEYDLTWKMIECHEIDILRPGDGSRVSFDWASTKIDDVKAIPRPKPANGERQHYGRKQPAAAHEQRYNSQPAECGLYRRDGRLYIVREFKPQGESERVRFARELVPTDARAASRAGLDGESKQLRSVKAPRMQWSLRADEAVPIDEVEALGIEFGECIICGQPIETAASVKGRHGMGKVCYDKQLALVGRAA
jgi:hypothetical protein